MRAPKNTDDVEPAPATGDRTLLMPMLRVEIVWLVTIAAVALLAGTTLNLFWPALSAGLGLYAGRHLYHLLGTIAALAPKNAPGKSKGQPPWALLHREIERLQRRNRKRKRRLSRAVKRFRDATNALPDGVVVLDRFHNVEWFNTSASKLLGLRWPDDAGRYIEDVIRTPLGTTALEGNDAAVAIEIHAPADPAKMIALAFTPFGKRGQQLLTIRDVTRILFLDRMREDFVANASHEFKTPLTILRGALEALEEPDIDQDERQHFQGTIAREVSRLNTLVEDLLRLSKLESSPEPVLLEPVDMDSLLGDIVHEARRLSANAGHQIIVRTDSSLRILGDRSELRSAFSNLVFNAVLHTPPRTDIDITWESTTNGARLVVRDNGEGIPRRHLPRLSERFYRVDPARSRNSGGTGLGLAITKHVLSRHDAELLITSNEGAGSVFSCVFPNKRVESPDLSNAGADPSSQAV